jgi:hypothetical protein
MIWRGDFRSKLTLNHPSLIYQEEKKKWAMARVREEVQITGMPI